MNYAISHETVYQYHKPIKRCVMELRMQPSDNATQAIHGYLLDVSPTVPLFSYVDWLGNRVLHFNCKEETNALKIKVKFDAEIKENLLDESLLSRQSWQSFGSLKNSREMMDWLLPSHYCSSVPELLAFARDIVGETDTRSPWHYVRSVNQTFKKYFTYAPKTTNVHSVIQEALVSRMGVCQDFSHIMITLFRNKGIPARYVSGYLFHNQDVSAPDASHAWVEVFIPGQGWVGLDPTNDLVVQQRHIKIAIGRDYKDVPPSKGVFFGDDCQHDLSVAVSVQQAQNQ